MRQVVCFVVFLFAPMACAQVIYAPVRFQYGGELPFYYGGSNPHVIAHAWANRDRLGYSPLPAPVYSDAMPYWNAQIFGYKPDDAQNDANASIPTYFRKAELIVHDVHGLHVISSRGTLDGACIPGQ